MLMTYFINLSNVVIFDLYLYVWESYFLNRVIMRYRQNYINQDCIPRFKNRYSIEFPKGSRCPLIYLL